jgi:hypothetical protein
MFNNLVIPNDKDGAWTSQFDIFLLTIISELSPYTISEKLWESGDVYTDKARTLSMMRYIDTLNDPDGTITVISAYFRSVNDFKSYYSGLSTQCIGICICKESFNSYIESDYPEARHLEAAEYALKQSPSHELKIFQNPINNVLYVFTNKLIKWETLYKLKAIQNKLDETYCKNFCPETIEAYKAFTENNPEALKTALEKAINNDKFKEILFTKFYKLFTKDKDSRIQNFEYQLSDYRNQITEFENRIANAATKIKEINEELDYLLNSESNEENIRMLKKYLDKHPYIKHYTIGSGSKNELAFYFEAPIQYYSDYAVEKLQKNYKESDIKYKILQLFLDKRYQLWTRCELKFNVNNFGLRCNSLVQEDNFINHPHIDEYHCLGNHRDALDDPAKRGDYLTAIEQISQSVMNMNFFDACVARFLIVKLTNNLSRFKTWIDTETGEILTTEEAIERTFNNAETPTIE